MLNAKFNNNKYIYIYSYTWSVDEYIGECV